MKNRVSLILENAYQPELEILRKEGKTIKFYQTVKAAV